MKNKSQYSSRERKLTQRKRAWIKHWEGKHSPIIGISKQWKEIVKSKIKMK